MSFVLAVFVVLVFAGVLEWLSLPDRARDVGRRSKRCLEILRDGSMSDLEKERRLQDQARRLTALVAILGGGSALALAVPLGAVWMLDAAGLASLDSVLGTLERVDFLAGTSIVAILGLLIHRRRQRT